MITSKTCRPFLFVLLMIGSTSSFSQQFKALLFTKTDGFHHESILAGVEAIKQLAIRHHFAVDWQENAGVFNDKALENYKVIIFLNTTGNVLNDEQQAAFEKFIIDVPVDPGHIISRLTHQLKRFRISFIDQEFCSIGR